jgi:hypothetical protein
MKLERNKSGGMGNGSFNQEGRFMGQEGSVGLIGGKNFSESGRRLAVVKEVEPMEYL